MTNTVVPFNAGCFIYQHWKRRNSPGDATAAALPRCSQRMQSVSDRSQGDSVSRAGPRLGAAEGPRGHLSCRQGPCAQVGPCCPAAGHRCSVALVWFCRVSSRCAPICPDAGAATPPVLAPVTKPFRRLHTTGWSAQASSRNLWTPGKVITHQDFACVCYTPPMRYPEKAGNIRVGPTSASTPAPHPPTHRCMQPEGQSSRARLGPRVAPE